MRRVSLVVTNEEYRALGWMARKNQLQRYPDSPAPKRPGRGRVLKTMSVEQALEQYRNRPEVAGYEIVDDKKVTTETE